MASGSKPTFIFCHGAWHGPEYWQKSIIPALESDGFRCVAKQMVFAGNNPANGIKPAIDQMAALIEAEVSQGRNVIVVNHSFGGSVGSSGTKGYTASNPSKLKAGYGHVIGICQICAFIPPNNTALIDLSGPREHGGLFYDRDSDGWEVFKDGYDIKDVLFNECPQGDIEHYLGMIKKQRADTHEGPLGREGVYAGWMDVPSWYLLCTKDNAIPISLQEEMVRNAREMGADLTTRTLETDHMPFYSRPRETLDFITEAASAMISKKN